MAPTSAESTFLLGSLSVGRVYWGASLVWEPGGAGGLPSIGESFEDGYFAGLISTAGNGVATHALVVAPRVGGTSGSGYSPATEYAWKTSLTSTANTNSTYDGVANTAGMVAGGIANHPAAEFCVTRTIGGKTDWYLPSVLELSIAYVNLKPTTNPNLTSVGANAYAVPPRASNYTSADPSQTGVQAFTSPSGAERFQQIAHVTSTQVSAAGAPYLNLQNGGYSNLAKTGLAAVRAFRRVVL